MPTVTVFRDSRAILAESLVWDPERRAMLWCDITAGTLHASGIDDPADGSADSVLSFPPPLASFHRAPSGYVVSLGDRVVLADADGTEIRELGRIDHAHPGMRLNEGKVDPRGRWVTGSMDLTRGAADGAFYVLTEDDARVLVGGVGTANGLEWSLDGERIYFTDTSAETIYTGTYTEDGETVDVTTYHHGSMHDGLVIDEEGHLWSAEYGAGRVRRMDPQGRVVASIDLPAPNVTSVAFGGHDLDTLYVASARENLTEDDLAAHPLSGAIFSIDVGVRGRAAAVFGVGR